MEQQLLVDEKTISKIGKIFEDIFGDTLTKEIIHNSDYFAYKFNHKLFQFVIERTKYSNLCLHSIENGRISRTFSGINIFTIITDYFKSDLQTVFLFYVGNLNKS